MKKFLFLSILFITSLILGQELSVVSKTVLSNAADEGFYHPHYIPGDNAVIVSKENYKGLWVIKRDDHTVRQINNHISAGYSPAFSSEGLTVYYRADEFINKMRYSSIIGQNLLTGAENIILSKKRDVTPPEISGSNVVFTVNSQISKSQINTSGTSKNINEDIYVKAAYGKITIYKNGKMKNLTPFGDGPYVWPSLSPDRKSILFTFGNKGVFISDLDGNIKSSLGYGNAPKWSPDGKWITFMVDEDNGEIYTASEIYVSSTDGRERIQLTDSNDEIEMYPDWSSSGRNIVYNTLTGKIYEIELKIKKGGSK